MSVSLSLLFSPRHHAGWLHLVAKAVTPSLFFHCSFTLLLPHMSYIPVPSPSSPYLPSSPSYFFLSHLTFTFIIFFLFHLTPPSYVLPVPLPSSLYLSSSPLSFFLSHFTLSFIILSLFFQLTSPSSLLLVPSPSSPYLSSSPLLFFLSSHYFFLQFSFSVLSAYFSLLSLTSSLTFISLPSLINIIIPSLFF